MTFTIAKSSPGAKAKIIGLYYLLTILGGVFVLLFHGKMAFTADLGAVVFFVGMTLVFYEWSKPATAGKGKRI